MTTHSGAGVSSLAKTLHDLAHPAETDKGAGTIYVTMAERLAFVLREGDAGALYEWLASHAPRNPS